MLKTILTNAFAICITVQVNAQWTDNFTDKNFTQNPTWGGDTSKFKVDTSGMLQLVALSTDTKTFLYTTSNINVKAEWNFKVRMGFNPSSTNYAKVYLMCDTVGFTDNVNGYFLRVGHTTDDVCLYKQSDTSTELLIDGRDKMLNTSVVNARIKVLRDSVGNWQLYCDSTGNEDYVFLGSALDNSILQSQYFSIQCFFTSTRADKFFFDDFKVTGSIYVDPNPPVKPSMFDVVINEIMADPTPNIALPEAEYLELYNRSEKNFRTKNWTVQMGSSTYTLPDTLFNSGEYLVITAKNVTSQFAKWCKPLEIFSSASVLTNAGEYIALKDNAGNIISWVSYSDTWYKDDYKSEGGWSLEQIDPNNFCGGINNWTASNNKSGGTPGTLNSVNGENPDLTKPSLKWILPVSDSVIRLTFNEPLNISSTNASNFSLENEGTHPNKLTYSSVDYSAIDLWFNAHLKQNETTSLYISSNVTDCALNNLGNALEIPISLPTETDSADIIINEVLFNAEPYCPDFIELYNRSQKIVNTADLLINLNDGTNENTYRIQNEGFLLFPGDYILLSEGIEKLSAFYTLKNENSHLPIPNMVSLDDNAGKITLKTLGSKVVDQFSYSENMQMTSLVNKEGISLERINSETPAWIASNWHSAAETAGYATPGYQNSQYQIETSTEKNFVLENEVFSPDNDGYNDILTIAYKLDKPGARVFAWAFDMSGRKVKELFNNALPEASGNIYWDGKTDKNELCRAGMYLLFFRVIYTDGETKEYKLPCVLAIKK